jgi:hypothetical protein
MGTWRFRSSTWWTTVWMAVVHLGAAGSMTRLLRMKGKRDVPFSSVAGGSVARGLFGRGRRGQQIGRCSCCRRD